MADTTISLLPFSASRCTLDRVGEGGVDFYFFDDTRGCNEHKIAVSPYFVVHARVTPSLQGVGCILLNRRFKGGVVPDSSL